MKRFLKARWERAVFAIFAAALLASVSWHWRAKAELKRVRANLVGVHLAKSTYQPTEWTASATSRKPWEKPSAQSAGSGWVYELFTPPAVFFNQTSGQFVVTPLADTRETVRNFAIELIAVRRELFRLQLSGYFGEPGNYTAVFAQPGKPGALFAREGVTFAEPAVTLRKFFIRRDLPADTRGSGGSEPVAFAELRDEGSGQSVMLNSREPTFADEPVAVVKTNLPKGSLREVRAGDVISEGTTVYRINRVTYSPAEMVVSREESGTAGVETKVLRPVGGETPALAIQTAESLFNFPRLATGFVTPEK